MAPAQYTRGKGLSLARRLYTSRTLGLALGFFCVATGMSPLQPAPWVWGFMLFNAFAWPHLAYQWARLSRVPFRAEYRNLLMDSLLGGFWVAAMHFNPLPLATTLGMMAMNNIALGGVRFFLAGCGAQVLGIGIGLWVFGPSFIALTTPEQLYACLPMLTLYPMALGYICYQQAVTLGRHKRELLALSRTDSLTGLLNHGAWKDQLEIEFQRCQRQTHGGAIALIDIDHFKAINDTYGHLEGDQVLLRIAESGRGVLRRGDLFGRIGGEEFAAVFPGCTPELALQVAQRLQREIQRLSFSQDEQVFGVTVSQGLTGIDEEDEVLDSLFARADAAMYQAKRQGKNQIVRG